MSFDMAYIFTSRIPNNLTKCFDRSRLCNLSCCLYSTAIHRVLFMKSCQRTFFVERARFELALNRLPFISHLSASPGYGLNPFAIMRLPIPPSLRVARLFRNSLFSLKNISMKTPILSWQPLFRHLR